MILDMQVQSMYCRTCDFWVSSLRFQVQVTVHSSVQISGASVSVNLGYPKTIVQISRVTPLNRKFSNRKQWLVLISISEYQSSHMSN